MYDQSFYSFQNKSVSDPNDYRVLLLTSFRKTSDEFIYLMEKCWEISPVDTVIILFHLRDVREGKKDKKRFLEGMKWIQDNHPNYVRLVIPFIPVYGTYKDIWVSFCGTPFEEDAVEFYAKKLEDVHNNAVSPIEATNIVKYAPREKTFLDKKYNLVKKLSKNLKISKAEYRKKYIRTLGEFFPSVERKMCRGEWSTIDYSSVPSNAFKRYRNAFLYHDRERFCEYMHQRNCIVSPKNKFQSLPEIIMEYTKGNCFHPIIQKNLYLEDLWKDRLQKIKLSGILNNILCVIDLSGSMHSRCSGGLSCFSISFALAMASSSFYKASSPFFGKWLTYSTNPQFYSFHGDDLYQKINTLDPEGYDNSLRVDRLYLRFLDFSVGNEIDPNEIPSSFIVLTDAPIEHQYFSNRNVDWKNIFDMYQSKGYSKIPQIIFWNILSEEINEIPVCDATLPFCKKIDGYTPILFDEISRGFIQDPSIHLQNILNGERYSLIIKKLVKDNVDV